MPLQLQNITSYANAQTTAYLHFNRRKIVIKTQFILVIENVNYANPITITTTCNWNSNNTITIKITWINYN